MHVCPSCKSQRIVPRHCGKKVGGSIGTAAGAMVAVHHAKTGASMGAPFGVFGLIGGGVAGLALAGLRGGFLGGSTGISLGTLLDSKVLDAYKCLSCNLTFNIPEDHTPLQLPSIDDEGPYLDGLPSPSDPIDL
jgi:hypothetical protein